MAAERIFLTKQRHELRGKRNSEGEKATTRKLRTGTLSGSYLMSFVVAVIWSYNDDFREFCTTRLLHDSIIA